MAIYYGDGTNSNGSANGGRIVQCITSHKTGFTNHTGQSWSTNVPDLSPSITMSDSNNKVLVMYNVSTSAAPNVYSAQIRLLRGTTAIGVGGIDQSNQIQSNNHMMTSYDSYSGYTFDSLSNGYLDSPGSGTHTYAIQLRSGYANYQVWINRSYTNPNNNNVGSASSYITLFEIAHS